MARRDITIHRDFQIINGFVQLPPNREVDKIRVEVGTALALAGSDEIKLTGGSGRNTGWKAGSQHIFRLPGLIQGAVAAVDPIIDILNT